MHQFTTVFSNDFQICSLISKSGVTEVDYRYHRPTWLLMKSYYHNVDSEFDKLFPLLYRRNQAPSNSCTKQTRVIWFTNVVDYG